MFEAWINMWKNGLKFESPHRTQRREFWYAMLINIAVTLISSLFLFFIATRGGLQFYYWIFGPYAIANAIVGLSLSVRRLRDAGFSVWWVVLPIILIPAGIFGTIANIVVLVMCAFPTKVENEQPLDETQTPKEED